MRSKTPNILKRSNFSYKSLLNNSKKVIPTLTLKKINNKNSENISNILTNEIST